MSKGGFATSSHCSDGAGEVENSMGAEDASVGHEFAKSKSLLTRTKLLAPYLSYHTHGNYLVTDAL